MGNRLSRQDSAAGTTNYAYNAANMLTGSAGAGGSSYTNDQDGDTLTGGGRAEAWDSQNRMTSCTVGGVTSTFTYGADGLRRSMTSNGVTTYYAYDGQTMIREMQGTPGSLHATATYLTGPRGPEYRRDDTHTEPDGQGHTFGVTRWYVYDGLGSVVGEVDPLGNVTCSDKYDVYGAVRGRTGAASTAHGFVGSLGHLSDAATGLFYMRARYYDPGTGRFTSEDPSKNGSNWFVYASNNPVNRMDADGRVDCGPWDIFGILLAGLVAGGMACLLEGEFSWATFGKGFAEGVVIGIAALWGPLAGAVAGGIVGGIMGYENGHGSLEAGIIGAFFGALGGVAGGALALSEGVVLEAAVENVVLGAMCSDGEAYSDNPV